MIEFDPKKNAINIAKHGISLERAGELIVSFARFDDRADYGEDRVLAYGYLDGLVYCLCFVERNGKRCAISLRRAREKELKQHVKNKQN